MVGMTYSENGKSANLELLIHTFRGISLHLAENGRLIAKQSYVGKEGAEERGRGEKTEFFSFLIFFI
ncbi:TPA: hypothetical protein MYM67_004560 [Klebsiella pneumoniae]|nr:hypothetical protein [Klebsiella pneumoniae]